MLALQLLPTNSCGGIVVITDGVINVPDVNTLDTLLSHLRTKTISLSFIQVQSRLDTGTFTIYLDSLG